MSKKTPIKLSLILPIYNEEAVLDDTLTRVAEYLEQQKIVQDTEVVCAVTHDGDDKSLKIAKRHKKNFDHYQVLDLGGRLGKGKTVAEGIAAAKGQYKIFTDADLATPLHHIEEALKWLEEGEDLVIGVRDLHSMHDGWARRTGSVLTNLIVRAMAAPGIDDTQCGFKGFNAAAAETVFSRQRIGGWGFDFEIIAVARAHHMKIEVVDIPDWHDPKETGLVGDSQASAMLKTLIELFKVRINAWRGLYK